VIEHLDLINLSHYDIGFTDHPTVCRALQVRYLDQAIDLVLAWRGGPPASRFHWTCEANNVVWEWWQQAPAARRDLFLELVQEGLIEVCAMPFNQNPTLDAQEWRCLARWLPDDLWRALRPRTIMQSDVNGFPRAGAMALMERGAEFLWMGLNQDTGGSPLPQPGLFWWAMPDGRKLLVWNSLAYPSGYYLFEPREWRRGPLPLAADARYRPPAEGDFFSTAPEALERARQHCQATLRRWEERGYSHRRAAISMTNMWRVDNDPPCQLLPAFVAAWNAAGFTPTLALTTPTPAIAAIRDAAREIPTLSGEWTDWWANGTASTPRELAASRRAKRLLWALDSSLYPPSPERKQLRERCLRELCFFDEHTWGAWNSVSQPESLNARGQFAEKASLAYRPLALAELALGEANRALAPQTPGIHVVNPYSSPFTGWVTLTDDCLRGEYEGVEDVLTGQQQPFHRLPGLKPFAGAPSGAEQFSPLDRARVFPDRIAGQVLRMWVQDLEPGQVRSYRLLPRVTAPPSPPPAPCVQKDATGWPSQVRWPQTTCRPEVTLFTAPIGDLVSLEFGGFAPRWTYKAILSLPSLAERRAARERWTSQTWALPQGETLWRDTGPTLEGEQYLTHPRLHWLRRKIEIFKDTPRVQLTLSLSRISQPSAAEILYLRFPLACPAGATVRVPHGGLAYQPGREQIPHTCKDFHVLDDRLVYAYNGGRTILDCPDNALVELGGLNDALALEELTGDLALVYVVLYNNIWYTNFAGDEAGAMEFRFDLYHRGDLEADFASEAYPVVRVPAEG